MHKFNWKVLLWLDYRDFHSKEKIQENGDFLAMNSDLEREYDEFKKELEEHSLLYMYIPANELLYYWHEIAMVTPLTESQYGKEYFKMTQDALDTFHHWMKEIRDRGYVKEQSELHVIIKVLHYLCK